MEQAGNLARLIPVALLAEGVDRNQKTLDKSSFFDVALLAEGVDRNLCFLLRRLACIRSPSSQRAWIEITLSVCAVLGRSGRPPRRGRG